MNVDVLFTLTIPTLPDRNTLCPSDVDRVESKMFLRDLVDPIRLQQHQKYPNRSSLSLGRVRELGQDPSKTRQA